MESRHYRRTGVSALRQRFDGYTHLERTRQVGIYGLPGGAAWAETVARVRLLSGRVVMYSTHSSNPEGTRVSVFATIGMLLAAASLALAGAPAHFVSRGPGGGGAFFGPSINPFNPDELWVGSDMSDLFHSTDFGRTWETVDFRLLGGGSQPGRMEFTSNPLVRYALNSDVPARSADGGVKETPESFRLRLAVSYGL